MASSKRENQLKTITASSIILDIEGTTSSISFVKDVLFPYVLNNLEVYLNDNWSSNDFQEHVKALRNQAQEDVENKVEGVVVIPVDGEENALKKAVIDNIKWQMDNDRKTKSLKDLQGLIMEKGYKCGDLKAHLYEDVEPSFKSWVEKDKSIYIYSSGSIQAQKLLFGHSEKGDLLPLIKGHFDTTVGMKADMNSYKEILNQIACTPSETVFFTDVPKEARAAKEAGILALLILREGNAPLSDEDKAEFQVITSFEDIEFEQNCKKRKTASENVVNIDNKEIESCSLSIKEENKPNAPQVVIKSDEKQIDTKETSIEKTREDKTIDASVDEPMDVDDSPSEKAPENKTNEKVNNANQEESSTVKEETINSEKTSNTECEMKSFENVDNRTQDESKETISSEFVSKESIDNECKIKAVKYENCKEEVIDSNTENKNNKVADAKCKTEDKEGTVLKEETGANTSSTVNEVNSKDVAKSDDSSQEAINKDTEGNLAKSDDSSQEANNKDSEGNLAKSDDSSQETNNKDSEGNLKSNEDTNTEKTMLNKTENEENVTAASDDSVTDKKVDTKEDLKSTSSEVRLEEEVKSDIAKESCKDNAISTTNISEDTKDKVAEVSNGIGHDNLGDEAISKGKPDVENNSQPFKNEERDKTVVSDNNISSKSVNDKLSVSETEKNSVSKECESDVKLEESKDVIKCDEQDEATINNVESNGSTDLQSTNNETEVPLIEKTDDDSKGTVAEIKSKKLENGGSVEILSKNGHVSKNGDNENGISSPDLKKDNNLNGEVTLEGKKCDTSENKLVETVVED